MSRTCSVMSASMSDTSALPPLLPGAGAARGAAAGHSLLPGDLPTGGIGAARADGVARRLVVVIEALVRAGAGRLRAEVRLRHDGGPHRGSRRGGRRRGTGRLGARGLGRGPGRRTAARQAALHLDPEVLV